MDFNFKMPGHNVWLKFKVYTTLRYMYTRSDLNKSNRPCILLTNRLSTSVHSSKNLVHSTGILTIASKFIVVFEKIFFWNQKKCYVPENFNEREVIPPSRPSQQAPSPDFSSEFLCLVIAIAINSLLFVCICLSSAILQGFMGYGYGTKSLGLEQE